MKRKTSSGRTQHAADASSPRSRTLSHLDRLLRGATVAGASVVLAWSSRADAQRPPQVCDPLPPPVNCKAPDRFTVESCVAQQTRWVKAAETWNVQMDLWVLSVGNLRGSALPTGTPPEPRKTPGGQQPPPVTFADLTANDVKVTGGRLQSLSASETRVDLTLVPNKDAKTMVVRLPNPSHRTTSFGVSLDISTPPSGGKAIPVKLVAAEK